MPCSKCRKPGHNSSTCNQHLLISKISPPTLHTVSIPCNLCRASGYIPMPPHSMYPCQKCGAQGVILVQTTNTF
ncbi:hypothetical protein RB653_004776 [Dictyostelium firmibasis]|uniref:CCHC-type domain-containing protein n=1 Tax=Dictyostelium firmibasis TaxID=79012 RepID=A0AAN7UB43_9MYCE